MKQILHCVQSVIIMIIMMNNKIMKIVIIIYTLFRFDELTELRPLIDLKNPFCEPVEETRVFV